MNSNLTDSVEGLIEKRQSDRKLKRKIVKYRTATISITIFVFVLLSIVFSNIGLNDVLILSLPLLLTAFFGYASAEDVFKEKSKGRNIIQVALTFLVALAIGFASKSSSNTQALITKKEKDSLQRISDSTIAAKVAVKVDSIYGGISRSFKDQGLKLDSVNFEVSKLRDSAKIIIMNAQVKNPILDILNGDLYFTNDTLNTLRFKIHINCFEEAAKGIKLYCVAETDYMIGIDNIQSISLNFGNMAVGQTQQKDLHLSRRIGSVKSITFLFFGKCSGTYPSSKEFKIEPILYIFNMQKKWATRYDGQTKKNAIDKYKEMGYDL